MADGLTNFDVRSCDRSELFAYLGNEFAARAVFQFERGLYFRNVYSERMFIQFGTSRFAGYGLYFGDGEQQFFGTVSHFVALFQRNTRQRTDIDGKRALIERRQEAASECEEYPQSNEKEGDCTSQRRTFVCQHPCQRFLVNAFHPAGYERFFQFFIGLVAAQQIRAEYRSQCQGNHRRSEQRHDECNAQRHQHASFHSTQEEQRDETDNDDQR